MSETKHHASQDSLAAMKENDAHNLHQNDAVPGGPHAHSHATHEAGAHPHTKPMEGEKSVIDRAESDLRIDRGHANNRGVGAGLRGDSGTRGQ